MAKDPSLLLLNKEQLAGFWGRGGKNVQPNNRIIPPLGAVSDVVVTGISRRAFLMLLVRGKGK